MKTAETKTALVTGAAGGMGLACAKRLLAEGYTVYGLDLREPEPTEGLRFLKTDLTDPASVEAAAAALTAAGVRLDCIVHLAGIYDLNSLIEMPEEEFRRIFEVNLFGVYRVNRCCFPLLRQGARIVITTSELAPLDPLPFTGIYAITKTALDSYAAALRMELQLLGCRVVVLRPGAVDTGLLQTSTRRLEAFCENTTHYACNAARFRRIVERVEARKLPPERIAGLVLRSLNAGRPRPVYSVNRNPLLLLLDALPLRMQCRVIKRVLKR